MPASRPQLVDNQIGHHLSVDGFRGGEGGKPDGVPRYQSRTRRWTTAARWPLGVALTSWRYFWRTTPAHRWELTGSWPADAPPDLPDGTDTEGLQQLEDGVGPLVHRIYRTRIVGAPLKAEELMGTILENLDCMRLGVRHLPEAR